MTKTILLLTFGFCLNAYSSEFASPSSNSFGVIKDLKSGSHQIIDLNQVANFDTNDIDLLSTVCADQGGDPSQSTSGKINSCLNNMGSESGCYAVLNNELDYVGCSELKANSSGSFCPSLCDYPKIQNDSISSDADLIEADKAMESQKSSGISLVN